MSRHPGQHRNDDTLRPIGAVVSEVQQTFPEVTHSGLRFLERENLVVPVRTQGGHRLFSSNDVSRIRQIKTWQQQRLSLAEIRQRLKYLDDLPKPGELARSFLQQALNRDVDAATRTILSADDVGLPLAIIFGDVLQPALVEIGIRWARGDLLVAQEKELSEAVRDLIAELSQRHAHAEPFRPDIVAGCVEGENHELGLLMLCGLLRAAGFRVRFLGASVAPRFLLDASRLHQPAAILLSKTLPANLPAVKSAIEVLTTGLASDSPPAIMVGGHITPYQQKSIATWGAVTIAEEKPAEALEAVLTSLGPTPEVRR